MRERTVIDHRALETSVTSRETWHERKGDAAQRVGRGINRAGDLSTTCSRADGRAAVYTAGTKSEFCEDNRSIGNASDSFREDGEVWFSRFIGADGVRNCDRARPGIVDCARSSANGERPSPRCVFQISREHVSPRTFIRPSRFSLRFCTTMSRCLFEPSFL